MSDQAFQALTEWRIKMENNQIEMSKDISEIKTTQALTNASLEAFHCDQKEQNTKILEMIKKIDENKANKWVEVALSRIVWIVVTTVIVALLYLIIK